MSHTHNLRLTSRFRICQSHIFVIDKGKSQTSKEEFGSVLYYRSVYNSMLIAEAIGEAQKITELR
jgi:hypothetical protein